MFDLYTRFNRKSIDSRKIDTLIGLCKGLTADGRVDQAEAEMLHAWLVQSRQATDVPIIVNLLTRVEAMLQDNVLDPDESTELLGLLRSIAGDPSEVGELEKSSSLPLDKPAASVVFPGRVFVFTGTCAFGTRAQCHKATLQLEGDIAENITKMVSFLVLGAYVTDSWIHETYGRKIEKAMEYRDKGTGIHIVSERQWADAGNLK